MICQGISYKNGYKHVVIKYSYNGKPKMFVVKSSMDSDVRVETFSIGEYIIVAVYNITDNIETFRVAYVFHKGVFVEKFTRESAYDDYIIYLKENESAISPKM